MFRLDHFYFFSIVILMHMCSTMKLDAQRNTVNHLLPPSGLKPAPNVEESGDSFKKSGVRRDSVVGRKQGIYIVLLHIWRNEVSCFLECFYHVRSFLDFCHQAIM